MIDREIMVRLPPDQLEEIARLTAARLRKDQETPQRESPGELLSAADVARRFGRTAGWGRRHRAELGVVTVGSGPRPRLMFDHAIVAELLSSRSESERSQTPESPTHGAEPTPAEAAKRHRTGT